MTKPNADTSLLFNRRLRFWDALGGKVSFSVDVFVKLLIHPRFLLFICLSLVLFFATDPSGNRAFVPLWSSIAIWPIAFALYMLLYFLLLVTYAALQGRFLNLRVPTPLIGCLGLLPTIYFSEAIILDIMSSGAYPQNLQGNFLFYYLSVQVIETVFFRYVFPFIDLENKSVKAPAPQAKPRNDPTPGPTHAPVRHVIIGGERIPIDKIRHIEAREHHVQVTLEGAKTRMRARLGDIVAQTTPEDGVQTHRSWWVARSAVKSFGQENGKHVLRLNCNRPIPVARTRLPHVQEWVNEHMTKSVEGAAK